ncbi:MAG: ATP-binding protein [Oscillospiraceae bacterium]|nr:ATP-binding protein [Oscillospiraceae bacterium]
MIRGNRSKINLTTDHFADFINNDYLYVDKTAFIEHIFDDPSHVLLFTRPRRMGKSLNIKTLHTFADVNNNSANLFEGLGISNSRVFDNVNKYCVIYLDFKNYSTSSLENFKRALKTDVKRIALQYLKPGQINPLASEYLNNDDFNAINILLIMENLCEYYENKILLLMDEYDKPLMDTIVAKHHNELKEYITEVMTALLKGNPYLFKAVITGVTRIAKESMFSNLNNLEIYDIFRSSIYDNDFSLTEQELLELVPHEKLDELRKWYNNVRVGDSLLYNIYSVMSYLRNDCKLDTYWSNTGNMNILTNLITPERAKQLSQMLTEPGYAYKTCLEPKLDLSQLIRNFDDAYYYSLAVQAGYLTYAPAENTQPYEKLYNIFIPNMEAQNAWRNQILTNMGFRQYNDFIDIFNNIDRTEEFSRKLTALISMKLSIFDTDSGELEKTYHVFIFGMILLLGYKCTSNLEAGFGRYDILIEAPKFSAVIEFKKSKSLKTLEKDVQTALKQIDDKQYYAPVVERGLPIYKIGIACYKKACIVKNHLHS